MDFKSGKCLLYLRPVRLSGFPVIGVRHGDPMLCGIRRAANDGRVQVVNNQRISVTQRQSCLDAKLLAAEGKNAKEIKEALEADRFNSSIYII